MVEDGAFSHELDYVIGKEIIHLEGHPNLNTGSEVTAILLNGWALPIGRASVVKGLRLQPAQQACLKLITSSLLLADPGKPGARGAYFSVETHLCRC